MQTGARMALWNAGKRLPYDSEVEYLQADGNSRLNASVALNSTNLAAGVTIKMTLDVPTAGNNRGLLAQGTGTYSCPWCVCTTATAGEIKIFSVGKFQSSFSGLSGPTDITVEVNSTTVYLDIGGTRKGGTYSTSYQYSDNLAILGYDGYNASSSATYPAPSGTRLYAYKMYVGNNLVADCIPVRVGTVGYLYDRVSGQLFGNAGTGDFVVGHDVVPMTWQDGLQYNNVGTPVESATSSIGLDYIPITAGHSFTWRLGYGSSASADLIIYNANKERIDYWVARDRTVTISGAAAYMRISALTSYKEQATVYDNTAQKYVFANGMIPTGGAS